MGEWASQWSSCWLQFRSWRTPPRWSTRDWWDEVRAIVVATTWHALHDFNPTLGRPLDPFVNGRIRARVLSRYRQEWSYGLRYVSSNAIESAEAPSPAAERMTSSLAELSELLALLSESDRHFLLDLFLDGQTEVEVARALGVSQPAVSKRKSRIIGRLQRSIAVKTAGGG
jgi:RNA polymerase sigma factor (sigma-70 family)